MAAEPKSLAYLPALDGLRGVATMLVILSHLPDQSFPDWFDRLARNLGYSGLDYFFVMSGFLITRILLAEKSANRPVKGFFVRRFLRLIPAFWLVVLAVQLWEPGWTNLWSLLYVINYTLPFHMTEHPLGHTWSLAVEEQFYLTWPWVVRGLSSDRLGRLLTHFILPGTAILAIVTIGFSGVLPVKPLLYMATPFRALSIGLGALMAIHEDVARSEAGVPWMRRAFAAAAVLTAVGWVAGPFRPAVTLVAYSMFSSGIVLALLVPRFQHLQAFLQLRPWQFLGRISYGLYLYHLPIYFALGFREGYVSRPKMLFAVALSIAVATASFYLIEAPALRLRRHFR